MARELPRDRQAVEAAEFNQLTVQRFVNPVAMAVSHSNSRNSRVVQTLCYFSLMRNSGRRNFLNSPVVIRRAERQMFHSSEDHQAAHYLPGQIWIDFDLAWRFISDPPTSRRLECIFGDVEDLPADYNKADSVAEQRGLCAAFRHVSELILRDTASRKDHANRELLRRVYEDIWIPQATNAFSAATLQKEERADIPELVKDMYGNILNLPERAAAMNQRFRFDEQKRILEHYMESMRTVPVDLRDDKIAAIERDFKP